jgi:hypothetical protein
MFLYYFAERQLSSTRYSREPSPPIFPLSKPQDSRHQSAVKQQKTLGINIPNTLLVRADEVVE